MARYRMVGGIYKKEPSDWPTVVAAIILIVIGIALFG